MTHRIEIPPGCSVAWAGRDRFEALASLPAHPTEEQSINGAGSRRKEEFRVGRHLARQALAAFGLQNETLERLVWGAPQWPAGVVGSISHHERHAVAVVAKRSFVAGLGIDLTADAPLTPAACDALKHPSDRTIGWVPTKETPVAFSDVSRMMFSAREAACKAMASNARPPINDIAIALETTGHFSATFHGEHRYVRTRHARGVVLPKGDLVMSLAWWGPGNPAPLSDTT